jgi:hypothetical protein
MTDYTVEKDRRSELNSYLAFITLWAVGLALIAGGPQIQEMAPMLGLAEESLRGATEIAGIGALAVSVAALLSALWWSRYIPNHRYG